MDADTGKIKWHFQHTPNDPYDYDSVAENVLVDVDGKKIALEADRNGFGYAVDRTDGRFLWATPFVKKVTWTKGIDPETGKPKEYDSKKQVQVYNPEATPVREQAISLTFAQATWAVRTGRRRLTILSSRPGTCR